MTLANLRTHLVLGFIVAVQFFYWFYFLNVNDTAKLFLCLLAIPLLALLFIVRSGQYFIPWLLIAALALFFWLLFASQYSPNPASSLYAVGYLFISLLFIQTIVLVDLTSDNFFQSFNGALLVIVTLVACFGLLQFLVFLIVPSTGMVIPYLLPPAVSFRVSGIYGQPNLFSLLLLIGLVGFFFHYLAFADKHFSRLHHLRMLPVGLIGLVFFLTQSRASIVALGAVAFCLCIAFHSGWLCRSFKQRKEFFFIVITLIVSFLLYEVTIKTDFLSWFFNVQTYDLSREMGFQGLGVDARLVFYTAAFLMFLDNPLFGVGLWQYKNHLPEYQNYAHDFLGFVEYEAIVYAKWAHNEYLQLLAEGGLIVGLCMFIVLLLYVKYFYGILRCGGSDKEVFVSFGLLIYIVYSLFTFPLHYPALLVLFLALLGLLLSHSSGLTLHLNRYWHSIAMIFLVVVFVFTCNLSIIEGRAGDLRDQITNKVDIDIAIDQFSTLVNCRFNAYSVLVKILPKLVDLAIAQDNSAAVKRLLPYAQQIVRLEGSYWEWFNLARIYLYLNCDDEAREAIKIAIDRKPDWGESWRLLHLINVRKAAFETGRPIDSFLPRKEDKSLELLNDANFSF